MSEHVNNVSFNLEIYPNIYISSKNLKDNRGLFLINPSLDINLINEEKLTPDTKINRSKKHIFNLGSFITSGTTKIIIANKAVKFRTFINPSQPELTGILGLPFLKTDPREFKF